MSEKDGSAMQRGFDSLWDDPTTKLPTPYPLQAEVELPSDFYSDGTDAAHRKKFGQVFTPSSVAALMADWVLGNNPRSVLDPAFGTGILAAACRQRNPNLEIVGFDIDRKVLSYVPRNLRQGLTLYPADFLAADIGMTFDGVTMNPPYIRHRELSGHLETRSSLSRRSGYPIPKSANLYVDFVVKACLCLSERGRGAFLIPAEWMSANFSVSLKEFLIDRHLLQAVVTFSNCSRVFDGALTTASLLLVENGGAKKDHVNSFYLQSISAEGAPRDFHELGRRFPAREVKYSVLRSASKWEPHLRGDMLDLPDGWTTLGSLASPRRGIATGSNDFFLVSRVQVRENKITAENIKRCIGRSKDALGLVFTEADFALLERQAKKCWLLDFGSDLSPDEEDYINRGESAGLRERFLLKTRSPWYSMEKRQPAPIWAGVFGRGDWRFVLNEAGIRSLTNFHCLYPVERDPVFVRAMVALLNSREVRDRMGNHRRGFGGGLTKFEPHDLKSIPIPDLRRAPNDVVSDLSEELNSLDGCARSGKGGDSAVLSSLVASVVKAASLS